jgi:hypothetical protein
MSAGPPRAVESCAVTRKCHRNLLLAGTLTLVLAVPATAHCFTINQLLDMPIEQLLRLEISSRQPPTSAAAQPPAANALRAVEHHVAT